MRVFVTGATGFIGSLVVKELIAAGHQVIGVNRSEDKAPALAAAGAETYRGSIDDPDSLKDGASRSDGVIHLAFNHDFSKFAANCETDRRVIEAIGSVLAGSGRPFIVTSGTAIAKIAPGELATEDAPAISSKDFPRVVSEETTADFAAKGVKTSVVRLPRCTTRSARGSSALGLQLLGKRACSPMSERGVTVGLQRMFPMSLASTDWRSKKRRQEPSTTRSPRKACRRAILRKPSAGA
jgi:NAD(P)-dependent dehydrogenase (short-subunit alcohol dehydrogenase family)